MPYQNLITQLRASLKQAYRQAIDADKKLDQLKQDGHANFSQTFPDKAGFNSKSNRFTPYLEELGNTVAQFEQAPDEKMLPQIVMQLELILSTLVQFKETKKK